MIWNIPPEAFPYEAPYSLLVKVPAAAPRRKGDAQQRSTVQPMTQTQMPLKTLFGRCELCNWTACINCLLDVRAQNYYDNPY